MTSTDNDRRILHSALEAACGPRPAEILMEHLPPAGWRDLVTKDDLVLARSGIQLEIEKLRSEVHLELEKLRTEVRVEIEKLRSEMHVGLEKLRTELIERIEQGFRSQTWKLIGALIASQSTTVGAIALFLR
jgi:cell division septum initiation protein DivIVA